MTNNPPKSPNNAPETPPKGEDGKRMTKAEARRKKNKIQEISDEQMREFLEREGGKRFPKP